LRSGFGASQIRRGQKIAGHGVILSDLHDHRLSPDPGRRLLLGGQAGIAACGRAGAKGIDAVAFGDGEPVP
jgi:hypothetical protein